MINFFYLLFALMVGVVLGLFYFSGLWLTVRQLPMTNHPVILTVISFFGRISVCLLGFFGLLKLVENDNPLPLFISLIAFFWVRNSLINRLQPRIILHK